MKCPKRFEWINDEVESSANWKGKDKENKSWYIKEGDPTKS